MTRTHGFFPTRKVLASAPGAILSGALAATLVISGTGHDVTTYRATLTAASNPVTPGNFTGFGFDQCQAPSQGAMDKWLRKSPYFAVGIYISGKSRGCRNQTYLNASWVHTQLSKGWKLLPITLGPQASCQPRFPRYGDDPTINPKTGNLYQKARAMGRTEAGRTVSAATRLGLVKGSVMYYDLEGFTYSNKNCRESAMWFLSAWTKKLHQLGYKSGVYSSAASGIKALDRKRTNKPKAFVLPDQVWIADWDGKAGTSSTYVSDAGWSGHRRVKQYQGGHNEKWGGVTINVDRDYVDVGTGSVAPNVSHCGGTRVNFSYYPAVHPPQGSKVPNPAYVKALKCLLKERGSFPGGNMSGKYGPGLRTAIEDWQRKHGFTVTPIFGRKNWMSLFAANGHPLVKRGSASEAVRDLQRALNAVSPDNKLSVTGNFEFFSQQALIRYQKSIGGAGSGLGNPSTWKALAAGRFKK